MSFLLSSKNHQASTRGESPFKNSKNMSGGRFTTNHYIKKIGIKTPNKKKGQIKVADQSSTLRILSEDIRKQHYNFIKKTDITVVYLLTITKFDVFKAVLDDIVGEKRRLPVFNCLSNANIVVGLNYNPTTRKLLFLRVNVNVTLLFNQQLWFNGNPYAKFKLIDVIAGR